MKGLSLDLTTQKYESKDTRLIAKTKDGYRVFKSYGSLSNYEQNKDRTVFNMHNPFVIDNIKLWLKINGIKSMLISDKFINAKTPLDWYCPTHDKHFSRTWDKVKRSGLVLCESCLVEHQRKLYSLSLNELNIKLASLNPNLKIISDSYLNNNTEILVACSKCGEEYITYWSKIVKCPKCSNCDDKSHNGNPNGFYSIYRAEKNKYIWTKKSCKVYIARMFSDNEEFYKIGITSNGVKDRFSSKHRMPYNYEIIKIIKTNLYLAVLLEKNLHKINKSHRYIPEIYFAGYTECFSSIDNVLNYLKDGLEF